MRCDGRSAMGILGVLIFATLGMATCGGDGGSPSPTSSTPPTTAPPPPTTTLAPAPPNVTGFWTSQARQWHIELRQSANVLTGVLRGYKNVTYSNLDHPDLQITGTITNAGRVDFGCAAYSLGFVGDVDSTRTRMTGTTRDCANGCRNYGEVWVK